MPQFILRALQGERGVTLKFLAGLFVITVGIFVFLSNTSCEGDSHGSGCGDSNSPINSSGSQQVFFETIDKPAFDAFMAGPVGPFAPGDTVHRTLGFSGSGVTRMVWTPPPGASNFDFSAAPPRQAGGPPFVFLNPPASFSVYYDLPGLPANMSSRKVTETLKCEGSDGSSSNASLVNTIQLVVTSAAASSSPFTAPQAPATTQKISVYSVDQYRSVENEVITTTQCQNMYDWLQGEAAFTAMRVPVTVTAPNSSFPLPVIFGPDQATRPVLKFTINGSPVSGIPDVPLEVRPDRLTYIENNLPAATGEDWLALGVAADPKVTCPQGMDQAGWEFHFNFPIDLVGKTTNLPFYYCYEGNNPPPIGVTAARILAGANAPAVQSEGITCLGPQDQSLDPNLTIHIGNPGVAWNIIPPKNVSFMHYLTESTLTPVNLTASSNLAGSTWTLYQGDDSAPDLGQPITNPWSPSTTFQFFWVVGNVPQGALAGSYSITVTAAKASDPATATHTNDLLWVGQWVPPAGGNNYSIFLPLVKK